MACKGRAIDVNTQTVGIPIHFTCTFLARRWGRDGPALLAHDLTERSNDILRVFRLLKRCEVYPHKPLKRPSREPRHQLPEVSPLQTALLENAPFPFALDKAP
jgi:hypothetical protein